VVTVRIGNLLGRDRGAPLDRLLSLPFVVKPMGRDPLVQFLQADDAAEVFVRAAIAPNLTGAFNAAGADPIPLSAMAGILEKRMFSLPPWLLRPMGGFLSRTHQVTDGQRALRELLQGVPLACERLDELGYTPRYTTRQALALWRANTLRALA
jgi:nucleoside-diphosphate-sugar epimerase